MLDKAYPFWVDCSHFMAGIYKLAAILEQNRIENYVKMELINSSEEKVYCKCCGYNTISEYGEYEICAICYWEDDKYQTENPESINGANKISLNQARKNFAEFGAVEIEFTKNVRIPNDTDSREY